MNTRKSRGNKIEKEVSVLIGRAESGTRTRDLLITNELLYQLSYFGDGMRSGISELRCKFICFFRLAKGFAVFFSLFISNFPTNK